MNYNKAMKNIIDYIKEYGNLTLEEYPFNNVDSLILSQISYIKFENSSIDIESEVHLLTEFENEIDTLCIDTRVPELNEELFLQCIHSLRYEAITISHLQTNFDKDNEKQFCAMTFHLPNQIDYIAFRGTDASFVGWKEDFNLSNGIVPSHRKALEYLEFNGTYMQSMIRLGGHSKGGNLAMYTAMQCDDALQEKILSVYDNDGPGFPEAFFSSEKVEKVLPKVTRIIPEASVIGMLLNHQKDPLIVASTQKGILQHDAFTWEVMGPSFIEKESLTRRAAASDRGTFFRAGSNRSRDDFTDSGRRPEKSGGHGTSAG